MTAQVHRFRCLCPILSTTPITAMGCWQCLSLSVVQLKGKHYQKTHCRNVVVDTFRLFLSCQQQKNTKNGAAVTSLRPLLFRNDFTCLVLCYRTLYVLTPLGNNIFFFPGDDGLLNRRKSLFQQ